MLRLLSLTPVGGSARDINPAQSSKTPGQVVRLAGGVGENWRNEDEGSR